MDKLEAVVRDIEKELLNTMEREVTTKYWRACYGKTQKIRSVGLCALPQLIVNLRI